LPFDYNSTLNLPKTDFPMRASLPEKEPSVVKEWDEGKLYERLIERNKNKKKFILHDGPPYANGNIHIGTGSNKILKDIIVRYKNMTGYFSPYVPGWDMHGLPTEHLALKKLGADKEDLTRLEIRSVCRDYAEGFVEKMTEQFKRLGVIGDWNNPYKTISPKYEAIQIEVFGDMAEKGYIYKGLKSVYWCPQCTTALAEAEIEYSDDPVESIYVRFKLKKDNGIFGRLGLDLDKVYFTIWTTTTWTLPANVAVALGPEFAYDIVKSKDEYYVVANSLTEKVMNLAGMSDYEVVDTFSGSEFEGNLLYHPYLDRESLVVTADFVTLDTGTGAVHIAPGHGIEDFELIEDKYPELPVIVPVDSNGIMTEESGFLKGLSTKQTNKVLRDYLLEKKDILYIENLVHQYPHCWRCKEPILFRATEQWFCSVEDFKKQTVEAIETVKWTPSWGKDRITSMVNDRRDWCISRQRSWGVPIPVFYCASCGEYHINKESIKAVSSLFSEHGSDIWFRLPADQILPEGTNCKNCGSNQFTKETDIMDVWFDSGVSHMAVLNERDELVWPADMYLEGSDQYRGWFQSSLLTAVSSKGASPYRNVLSHGWVVDGEGKKQSKSLGNVTDPVEISEKYGADILRLWVSSVDYQSDMRLSPEILKQLSEAYRKIRNTARFILGNLYDFSPDDDSLEEADELDSWALNRFNQLLDTCRSFYENYEFHGVYHAIHNFCVVDMSNFYLDILKDRLYIEKPSSATRRSAQTVIWKILSGLTLLIAPILPFTSEEIWSYLPRSSDYNYEAAVFNQIPESFPNNFNNSIAQKWDNLLGIRDEAKKVLEVSRKDKLIGSSLDAKVIITASSDEINRLKDYADILPKILIVSEVELLSDDNIEDGISISVEKASGHKCERCWSFSKTVGSFDDHPGICDRCREIVTKL